MTVAVCNEGYEWGWPDLYICTVYDRMYGDFPAKNTVCTPYIPINVWFWPTLGMRCVLLMRGEQD